jgi:hypothetical protein
MANGPRTGTDANQRFELRACGLVLYGSLPAGLTLIGATEMPDGFPSLAVPAVWVPTRTTRSVRPSW